MYSSSIQQYPMVNMRHQANMVKASLCLRAIVASHRRIFPDLPHLSLTRLLISQIINTLRNVWTRLPGASAGRIRQPRSSHPPISRHQAPIPALPFDVYTSTNTAYPISTSQPSSWTRFAYSLRISCILDASSTIPHPRSSITPSDPLSCFITPYPDYRSFIAESIFNSFNGRYPTWLSSIRMRWSSERSSESANDAEIHRYQDQRTDVED